MSKLIAVCVRDEKADCYSNPFFVPALGIALRMFLDWSKDPETAVGKHPEDYRLYRVGVFDQDSGQLEPEKVPVFLQSAIPKDMDEARTLWGESKKEVADG